MRVQITVPDYSAEEGLRMEWEDGFVISARVRKNLVHITANKAGLVSLARLLMTLANSDVPLGAHWHLDEFNALEPGSIELIIERR